MTDTVKCPSCETSFVPANVLARKQEPIVLKTRGDELEEGTMQKSTRHNSSPSSGEEGAGNRPEQIVWAVATLMSLCVGRNLLLLGLILVGAVTRDMVLIETEIPYLLSACLFTFPIAILVSWKLYRGRRWAKSAFIVFSILAMLSTSIYTFGMKLMSMYPRMHEFRAFIPTWAINLLTVWAVIVLIALIYALWWVNEKDSRMWLKSRTGTSVNKPWWIWAGLFNTLSFVALVVLIMVSNIHNANCYDGTDSTPSNTKTVVNLQNVNDDFNANGVQGESELVEHNQCMIEGNTVHENRKGIELERIVRSARTTNQRNSHLETITDIISNMVQIPSKGYQIGKTEVTQKQWVNIMGENPSQSEFRWDDIPIHNVSWNDCQVFLYRLNSLSEVRNAGIEFRLPTEQEWVFACRAEGNGQYCKMNGGEELTRKNIEIAAWFETGWPEAVGQKQPNAFGLYDMFGNVLEWTATANGTERVVIGGCYWMAPEDFDFSHKFSRGSIPPHHANPGLGFRLCASVNIDSKQKVQQ